jgi:hypothetical protein
MYFSVQNRVGHVRLDLPALVHLLVSRGGSDYWTSDHWVASARNDAGSEVGVFDFVYDRSQHRIRFADYGTLQPSDPRYGHAFPYSTPESVVQRVAAERHLSAKAGTVPELVFFPADPAALGLIQGATPLWTAGGAYPTDPIWLVVGADGHNYFVGKDSHVHEQSELPVAK